MTQHFWDSASDEVLAHPWCEDCQSAFFPPHMVCPNCHSRAWEWRQSLGRGTVYSYSVIHRAPLPGFELPYVLAVVDLDEGFELMTNIVGVEPTAVKIGMRVSVDWLDMGAFTLPAFSPHLDTEESQ